MNIVPAAFDIITLKSGVRSLRCRESFETFHPVVGPMAEARTLHVGQQRLVERAQHRARFVVWDVGLGAAANAIAVVEAFAGWRGPARVELHSFDETTAPLEFAVAHAEELGYLAGHRESIESLLAKGESPGEVEWRLHRGDFRELIRTAVLPPPDAILYDPYSAKTNPGMWTLEHFQNVRARLADDVPCLLTNYTMSTAVRVTLLLAGFFVGRGGGVGEKGETTVAANDRALLEAPLGRAWLERVRFSSAGAPLRHGVESGAIAPPDWDALLRHPQFAD